MSAEAIAADLADRFSLRKRPRSWGGDCPVCAYRNSFSMKVAKGKQPSLFCANGFTREQLSEAARSALGSTWNPPPPPDAQKTAEARAAKGAAADRLWRGSEPCAGTLAANYLAGRGLAGLTASAALRFRPDCRHPDGSKHPALIALVQGIDGQPRAVHRTYLQRDGSGKATVDPPKASLGPVWEAAIRLQGAADHLVIGEGIESAASAGLLLGLPAWAAISAGNLAAALILPPAVRTVTIAADPDAPGRRAASEAAARWRAEGRTVRIATPDRPGEDFNDLLRRGTDA